VSVEQKIPVSLDRTGLVTPGYLRDLRALVLNETADRLSADDAAEGWVDDALEDEQVTAEAVTRVLDQRYGINRVVFDPSDTEANRAAQARGFTVIPPRAFSKAAWKNVRRYEAARPAGQIMPSPKPFHPDGSELVTIDPADYTPPQVAFVKSVTALHERLIGRSISVVLADDRGWGFAGAYGNGRLTLNMASLMPALE
jgi:hypothetical protein